MGCRSPIENAPAIAPGFSFCENTPYSIYSQVKALSGFFGRSATPTMLASSRQLAEVVAALLRGHRAALSAQHGGGWQLGLGKKFIGQR